MTMLSKNSRECVPRLLKDLGMFLLYGLYPRWPGSTPPPQQNFGGGSFLCSPQPCWLTQLLQKICCQEGSGSSEFPKSVLLTFWTTCKNKARLIKAGMFKLWFILCAYVGGQERKLLSCVSIARLQQGNVSFGAWIIIFFFLSFFFVWLHQQLARICANEKKACAHNPPIPPLSPNFKVIFVWKHFIILCSESQDNWDAEQTGTCPYWSDGRWRRLCECYETVTTDVKAG